MQIQVCIIIPLFCNNACQFGNNWSNPLLSHTNPSLKYLQLIFLNLRCDIDINNIKEGNRKCYFLNKSLVLFMFKTNLAINSHWNEGSPEMLLNRPMISCKSAAPGLKKNWIDELVVHPYVLKPELQTFSYPTIRDTCTCTLILYFKWWRVWVVFDFKYRIVRKLGSRAITINYFIYVHL